jgi:carboxypeptidase Q
MQRAAWGGVLFALTAALVAPMAHGRASSWLDGYETAAARIITEGMSRSKAWDRLAELTDRFPARISGSENLAGAIAWAAARLREDGFDAVRPEPVMVPLWRRGEESAEIVSPMKYRLAMLGLGGSVGTGPTAIEDRKSVV